MQEQAQPHYLQEVISEYLKCLKCPWHVHLDFSIQPVADFRFHAMHVAAVDDLDQLYFGHARLVVIESHQTLAGPY